MATCVRMSLLIDFMRRLLPAMLLVLGVGLQCVASDSRAKFSTEDEHAKHCKCQNCRKESCCCGPRRSKPPVSAVKRQDSPSPVPLAELTNLSDHSSRLVRDVPPAESSGPCMGAAPCGDPGLPTASSPRILGDLAALIMGREFPPCSSIRRLRLADPRRPAEPPCARIDDPPECAVLV
jgi:hypothetical protein